MKKAVAILLLILFVPIFTLVVLYFSISTTLLNAQFVTAQLNNSQIYQVISETLIPQISTFIVSNANNQTQDTITNQAIEDLSTNLKETVNAAWLQSQFEHIYNQISNYLTSKDSSNDITLDLSPIRDALSQESITNNLLSDDFIKSQYDSTPKCSQTQSTDCIPSTMTYEQFKALITDELTKINSETSIDSNQLDIPEKLNVYESLTVKDESSPNFDQNILDIGRSIVQNINYAGYVSIGFIIAILLIIIFIFRQNTYFITKSFGITFLITSIIMFLFSALGYFTGPIINILLPIETASMSSLGLLIIPIVSSIISAIITKIIIVAIILLIISIILLIYSKKLKPKNKTK